MNDDIYYTEGDVARIQEGHERCGHLPCAVVERMLFGEDA